MDVLATGMVGLKVALILVTVWGAFRFLRWFCGDRGGGLSDFWEDFASPFHNWAEAGIFAVMVMAIILLIAVSEIREAIGF